MFGTHGRARARRRAAASRRRKRRCVCYPRHARYPFLLAWHVGADERNANWTAEDLRTPKADEKNNNRQIIRGFPAMRIPLLHSPSCVGSALTERRSAAAGHVAIRVVAGVLPDAAGRGRHDGLHKQAAEGLGGWGRREGRQAVAQPQAVTRVCARPVRAQRCLLAGEGPCCSK